ncbi:MAG: hypothetical protein IJZ56_01035 [Oscillospiraceae bacterium]|nr:hypothetical protein [Oscillospiraceae bacterium]
MELPKRKPNRLKNFNYNTPGYYFITICTQGKRCILGQFVGGGALDAPQIQLSAIGEIVDRHILGGNRIPGVTVEKYAIMPNHIHLLLQVTEVTDGGPSKAPAPTNAVIPHFVATLKRFCNTDAGANIFLRSYHDHIIRGEQDYLKIWQYIDSNPAKWTEDCFYVEE